MSDTIEDGKFVELNYRVVDVKTGDTLVTVDYPLGYVHGINDVMAEAVTKELYGKNIDQIVVLIASEDGAMQSFIKETKDYMEPLKKSIEEFYKYFHEQVKNKTS